MKKSGTLSAVLLGCRFALLFVVMSSTNAQHTVGRWAVSSHIDANVWFNDYNRRIVGMGGDVQLRYGFSRSVTLGGAIDFARFKSRQVPLRVDAPHDFLRLNSTSVSLLAWYHLLPGKPEAPYFLFGVGFMKYWRSTGTGIYLPPFQTLSSLYIPLGVGIERFSYRNMSFDFGLSYIIFDDQTDLLKKGFLDGALNVKVGINFYIGSSDDDDDDRDGLTNVEEAKLGTNPTNPDTDEDGLIDGAEVKRYLTDPLNADTDADRLKDGDEVLRYFTNPRNPDTDSDGISDHDELLEGTDPLNPPLTPSK